MNIIKYSHAHMHTSKVMVYNIKLRSNSQDPQLSCYYKQKQKEKQIICKYSITYVTIPKYLKIQKYLRRSSTAGIMLEVLLGIWSFLDAPDEILPPLLWSNQSSIKRAAAPLLSPLISEFVRLIEVPWVANQLKLPTGPHWSSTNFKRVISLSTSYLYLLRSAVGLLRYALGLRLTPASTSSPVIEASNSSEILEHYLSNKQHEHNEAVKKHCFK